VNKLIVCESCEAEYKIYHDMNDLYYIVLHCTFCGANLSKELEDHVEIPEDWCKAIGSKAYTDNDKSDRVALIRTFWVLIHIITCLFIIIGNGRVLGWW
jgi:hypothetical protein